MIGLRSGHCPLCSAARTPEEFAKAIRLARTQLGLNIPVLIFTTHHSGRLDAEVRQAGAQGYVLKSRAAQSLVLAIDTVLAGGTFFGAPPKPARAEGDKPNPGVLFCRGFALAV